MQPKAVGNGISCSRNAEGKLETYFSMHSFRLDNNFSPEMQCRIPFLAPLPWAGMTRTAGSLSSSVLHASVQLLLQYVTSVRMQRHK